MSRLRRVASGLAPWVVAAVTAVAFTALAPDPGYAFRASSAYGGYTVEGWTGSLRGFQVFFHTTKEKQPWVEIMLPQPQTISRVTVKNRRDQPKRGLPIVVEVKLPDGTFREVGAQKKGFREHTFSFEPVVTSTIRIRSTAKKPTYLHLERVDVD